MPILFHLLLALGLGSGAAAAQGPPASATERLVTMPLGDLAARTREREGVTQIDWVPPGETPDSARRMITIERLSGAAGDEAPMHMLRGLATCFSPCPGETRAPIDQTPYHGRPAARVTIDMPARAATGRPTRAYALAVSGARDLHFIAVIVRGDVSAADERFARDVLRSVEVCMPGSRAAACGAD